MQRREEPSDVMVTIDLISVTEFCAVIDDG